jgi:hypothetical protein
MTIKKGGSNLKFKIKNNNIIVIMIMIIILLINKKTCYNAIYVY